MHLAVEQSTADKISASESPSAACNAYAWTGKSSVPWAWQPVRPFKSC